MSYYLFYNGKAVSYFYPNGNGQVNDIIGFSGRSFEIFNSKEEAEERVEYFKRAIRERDDFDLKLSIKLFNIFDKIKVKERK